MTVSTTTNKVTYNGNGSTTSFSFLFPGVAAANILVFITDSLGNITQLSPSLYTVTLNNPISPNPTSVGGTVIYPLSGSPLALGSTITILRQLPLTQTTSLSNQSIIYPPVVEQTFDYVALLTQQDSELANRAFQVPVTDPVPLPVPAVAQRANQNAVWDSSGNLTAGLSAGSVPISAAMQPVVNSATLALARLNMGVAPNVQGLTTNYTVVPADDRKVFALGGGAFYTVTLGAASGFANNFTIVVVNSDTRGKNITIGSQGTFLLWPTQSMVIWGEGGGWLFTTPSRWITRNSVTFFVNPTLGNDANDGLVAGAGAFQTIAWALGIIQQQCDGPFSIQLADGTHAITSAITLAEAAVGNSGFNIVGNNGSPGNCIITSNLSFATLFTAQNGAVLNISGFQMNGPNNCTGFLANNGTIVLSNFICGTFGSNGSFAIAANNGFVDIGSSYHIAGGAQMNVHIYAHDSGGVRYNASSVTIDGSITVGFFMLAQFAGVINSVGTPVFVNPGNVTGKKYEADGNAVISVGGGGAQPPGTVAGTTSTGGQFI